MGKAKTEVVGLGNLLALLKQAGIEVKNDVTSPAVSAASAVAKTASPAKEVKADSVRRIEDYLGHKMVEVSLSGKRPKNMSLDFYQAFRAACIKGSLPTL